MSGEAPASPASEPTTAAVGPEVRLGDRVFLRIGGTDEDPVLRPALVVRVWTQESVNLQVFLDGHNDDEREIAGELARGVPGIRWCTSMQRGLGPHQWRLES